MLGGAERDRLFQPERRFHVGKDERGGAIGHQRTVGALEWTGDEGVLLALGAAEVIAEILAHLRVRIADAVLVVLGGDHRQRVGLVAPFLEIESGDLAENAGKAAIDVGLLTHVGRLQQVAANLRRRRRRHLLDTNAKHDTRRARLDALDTLMHGRRAGGAGILDAGCALEAQIGGRLQN